MSLPTVLAAARVPDVPEITIPAPRRPGVSSRLLGDVAVTTVTGPLDRMGVGHLIMLLEALQAGGAERLLVDLTGAEAHPSIVVGLASMSRRCTRRGGWLIVDGAPAVEDGGEQDLDLPLERLFSIYLQSRPV
jgi:hypothetical protein